jgi:hypothetical protein
VCIIVDTCVVHEVLPGSIERGSHPSDPYRPLRRDIANGITPLVFGGRLAVEYAQCSEAVRNILLELSRAGKALKVDAARVNAEEQALRASGQCRSDDPHVVALAKVSGARLVCTIDDALGQDFRDKNILGKPRGKQWSPAAHQVLRQSACKDCLG